MLLGSLSQSTQVNDERKHIRDIIDDSSLVRSLWESSLNQSVDRLTPIESACCHRFIELCKQTLFVVYRYSIDEKNKKQQQQQAESPTIAVTS